MALIFCRHGQTQFNLEDKFQGISDSPLTQSGIDEAKKINEFLKKNFSVKKFYISPALRVRKTYEILSEGIESTMHVVPELREVCYGDWEGKVRHSLDKTLLVDRESRRFNFVYPGSYEYISGESYKQVFERVSPFLKNLENESEDVCIIAHNGVLLSVIKYFEKLSDQEANSIRVSNDEILIVRKIDSKFELQEVQI